MQGTQAIHDGSHVECFACKLKSLNFGAFSHPSAVTNGERWANDPVVQRIEELHKVTIDTDAMNKRLVDTTGANVNGKSRLLSG